MSSLERRGANLVKLIRTIDMLSSRRGVTVEEIAGELEISKRSAYRLLSVVEELGFLLEDCRDPVMNRTRKRLDREFHQKIGPVNLPDIKFTASELVVLHLLRGESRLFKESRLDRCLSSAFIKISMFAPTDLAEKLDKLRSLFLLDTRMAKSLAGREEVIEQLTDAMLENRTCTVTYHSFVDDRKKSFRIDPLHFFEHQGGLYLFVRVTRYGDIRILAVERIQGVEMSDATFVYPEDFDPDEKLRHAFGLIYDDPVEVEIRFSAGQARYIRERIWAVNQRIIEQEDGSVILRMETSGRYEIKRWVLGYGAEAELLRPADLRREISEEIDRLKARYRDE